MNRSSASCVPSAIASGASPMSQFKSISAPISLAPCSSVSCFCVTVLRRLSPPCSSSLALNHPPRTLRSTPLLRQNPPRLLEIHRRKPYFVPRTQLPHAVQVRRDHVR